MEKSENFVNALADLNEKEALKIVARAESWKINPVPSYADHLFHI